MREVTTEFHSGELTLEGVLGIPEGVGSFPAVIACHPHPLYGGSMDNNVVNAICHALYKESILSFKFNFRGVGRSSGVYSDGMGEQDDVRNAISFVETMTEVDSERIGLVGYSAGAAFSLPVCCKDSRITALAAISPPLSMFDFEFLKDCLDPLILISGSEDTFTPIHLFIEFCESLSKHAEYHYIKGADHFWRGYEPELSKKVASFFSKALKEC